MHGTLLTMAFVILWRKTIYPQTIISGLYSKPSYLSNHHIKVWALYIQNHGLSSIFVIYFELKLPNFWEKFQKVRNTFKNVLKPGNMVCYVYIGDIRESS